MEPLHIGIKPDAVLGLVDFDSTTLFQEGLRFQEAGDFNKALIFYQRLIQEFHTSRYLSAAAYNMGRCFENLQQIDSAIAAYRIITQKLPHSKDWLDAAIREGLNLTEIGRTNEAQNIFQRILQRSDLTTSDRIEVLVLMGETLEKANQPFAAEKEFRAALRLFRDHEKEEYLDPDPAARSEFRLAQLHHHRFNDMPLRLPEEQMQKDLESKAQMLLAAQAGYLRCLRYGIAEWAIAAAFHIGQMYLGLHQAIETAPLPDGFDPQEQTVYRQMLRQRTGVLLRKALRVFEMTLEIANYTGLENQWSQKARQQLDQIEQQVLSLYEDVPPAENLIDSDQNKSPPKP